MAHCDDPVSIDDLHEYVDGRLNPVRWALVAMEIVRDPEVAARVHDYQEQRRMLHALFDPVLSEPMPSHLLQVISAARKAGKDEG